MRIKSIYWPLGRNVRPHVQAEYLRAHAWASARLAIIDARRVALDHAESLTASWPTADNEAHEMRASILYQTPPTDQEVLDWLRDEATREAMQRSRT